MTAVVIAQNRGDVLVGYGSKYLFEHIHVTKQERNTQRSGTMDKETARRMFLERLATWQADARVHEPLRFKMIMKDGQWKARFLVRGDEGTFGFPKGGLERGETFKQAALREFKEETGFSIPEDRLIPKPRTQNVFVFDATDDEREAILQAWREMSPEGELFDLQWMPRAAVQRRPQKNKPTRNALRGGRLTHRTRRHRK